MNDKRKLFLSGLAGLLILSLSVLSCDGTTDSVSDTEEQAGIELLLPAEGDYIPGDTITFSWEAVEDAENYRLRVIRQGDETVFYNRITGSSNNSHTVTHFSDDGEIYCWYLSVGDAEGWSEFYGSNCFTNSEAP